MVVVVKGREECVRVAGTSQVQPTVTCFLGVNAALLGSSTASAQLAATAWVREVV